MLLTAISGIKEVFDPLKHVEFLHQHSRVMFPPRVQIGIRGGLVYKEKVTFQYRTQSRRFRPILQNKLN